MIRIPTALILGGGAAMTSFVTGVLRQLMLSPQLFDAVYGCSAGALNGAYLITDQVEEAEPVWTKYVANWRVCSFLRNPLFRFRYPVDIQYLVRDACPPLDKDRLHQSEVKLFANAVSLNDGHVRYFHVNCKAHTHEDMYRALEATMTLTWLSKPVEIENHCFVDGGYADNIPALQAYRDGYRRLLIISPIPITKTFPKFMGQFEFPGRLYDLLDYVLFPSSKAARQMFRNFRYCFHRELWKFVNNPPLDADVYVIAPPNSNLPCGFFGRDVKKNLETLQIGRGVAKDLLKDSVFANFLKRLSY